MTRVNDEDGIIKPRLLTVKMAAAYFGLPVHTIYFWVETRRIPYVRIGRRVLFDRRSIEAWLAGQRIEAKTVPQAHDEPAPTSSSESSLAPKSRNRRRQPDLVGVEEVEMVDRESALED